MSDEETARTLLLVAGILQMIISVFLIFGVISIPLAIIGFVFGALWLSWRNDPMEHKTGAIVTGILGLILTGVIPGILALVAGAILPTGKGGA
jgi:hypothetical protein